MSPGLTIWCFLGLRALQPLKSNVRHTCLKLGGTLCLFSCWWCLFSHSGRLLRANRMTIGLSQPTRLPRKLIRHHRQPSWTIWIKRMPLNHETSWQRLFSAFRTTRDHHPKVAIFCCHSHLRTISPYNKENA